MDNLQKKSKASASGKASTAIGKPTKELDPVKLYLRDVGKTPLLNHAKEIELSQTIENTKQTIMDTLFAIPLTVRTVAQWIDDIAAGIKPATDVFDVETDEEDVITDQFREQLAKFSDLCQRYLADLDTKSVKAELIAADDEKIKLRELVKPEKKKKKGAKPQPKAEEPREFELKYSEIKKALIQIDWSKIKGKAVDLEESDADLETDESETDEN